MLECTLFQHKKISYRITESISQSSLHDWLAVFLESCLDLIMSPLPSTLL